MSKIVTMIFTVLFMAVFIPAAFSADDFIFHKITDGEVGKEMVCPVTKNTFSVTKETLAIEDGAKTVYFCCPACIDSYTMEKTEKMQPVAVQKKAKVAPKKEQKNQQQIGYWTCSMHPQVHKDGPGKCPICGMDLIPIYAGEEGKIIVDPALVEKLGIKSEAVSLRHLSKSMRLSARVAADNDLYILQQEYLSSIKNYSGSNVPEGPNELIEASRFRLSQIGYAESDLEALKERGVPDKNLIYPGNKVWLLADVFESDLAVVKPGQEVVVVLDAYPTKQFSGTLRFIETSVNPQTRSAKARIEIANAQKLLKQEMYAEVRITLDFGTRLAVQRTSVIDTGTRKVVYVDEGNGRFRVARVKTGVETDKDIEIVKGLTDGEKVVNDGNFMLDSQSTLTGGQSLLYNASEEIKKDKKEAPMHHH